ncbi:FH2 domain containing 3 [Paramormyrops kingsleyae]|uniref:FH2 domain containing 3 n=1 Tax=Paramormyrops kingsleyae TaxID=1676925 RepID=A0A3B3QKK7_9TELE|nr:FH2 domain-containing protein 1-like [Paramormyrops kingsleyae]XP_023660995.1 FH2 domain-containing protein 1-like [Paramormyrops kingsleyae]
MDGDVAMLVGQPPSPLPSKPSPGEVASLTMGAPPPPPPPPPLPPPPPGPTDAVGVRGGHFSRAAHRQSKMRNFNWDTLPWQRVLGKRNVWTASRAREDFPLDTKYMEELFSRCEAARPISDCKGTSVTMTTEMISILNSKKCMNIGIFLKQFKRPVMELIGDIRQGNWKAFGTGKLRELCKLLPELEEVKMLSAFNGDCCQLTEADHFMVKLVKVPGYEERLHSMVLKEEFSPMMEEIKEAITVMTTAANELLNCDDLHSVIRLVLKAGNYMNAGGYAGSAIGFRMSSLLKLVDTKANKPGMNLMHYVAMQAQEIDAALLKFPEQLPHIRAAARINKQEVEMDFQRQVENVLEARANASKHQELQMQMESFFMEAESQVTAAESSFQALSSVSHVVAEYFCEDPSLFKLDECCFIFHSFCEKFTRALQENHEREEVEERRRQQERQRSVAKRRSTATCSRTERDMESVALESLLHTYLTSHCARRKAGRTDELGNAGSPERGEPQLSSWSSMQDLRSSVPRDGPPSINDTPTPKARKSRSQASLPKWNSCSSRLEKRGQLSLEEEDEADAEVAEEVPRTPEASGEVLAYRMRWGSLLPGESPLQVSWSPGGAATSPASRIPQDEGSPRTILSLSPMTTPKSTRRHTISMPLSASWCELHSAPSTPIQATPPPTEATSLTRSTPSPQDLVAKRKSVDSFLSSPIAGEASIHTALSLSGDHEPGGAAQDLGIASSPQEDGGITEPVPGFRLGHLFQRRQKPIAAKSERQDGSAFVSFFKRLGERGGRHGDDELEVIVRDS